MLRPSSGENRRAPEMCSESLSATSRVAAARWGASEDKEDELWRQRDQALQLLAAEAEGASQGPLGQADGLDAALMRLRLANATGEAAGVRGVSQGGEDLCDAGAGAPARADAARRTRDDEPAAGSLPGWTVGGTGAGLALGPAEVEEAIPADAAATQQLLRVIAEARGRSAGGDVAFPSDSEVESGGPKNDSEPEGVGGGRGASCAESCAAAQDADGGHGHCGSASGGGPGAPRGAAL